MKNEPLSDHLRELSWRGKLTDAEAAEVRVWLATHPEAQTDLEDETGLNEMLNRLPNAPVPSNFTARVLQAVEWDAANEKRQARPWWGFWHSPPRWLPRAAFASVILTAGLVSFHAVRAAQRAELARSVAAVSDVSSLPSPQILTNFDVIYAMTPTPPADEELLALLK